MYTYFSNYIYHIKQYFFIQNKKYFNAFNIL